MSHPLSVERLEQIYEALKEEHPEWDDEYCALRAYEQFNEEAQ